jgi:hypothetical protein
MRRRGSAGDTVAILRTSGDDTSGDEMSEILKLFPASLARLSVANSFLSVAIFCGVGMLATLLLLIFDQNLFSSWAYP